MHPHFFTWGIPTSLFWHKLNGENSTKVFRNTINKQFDKTKVLSFLNIVDIQLDPGFCTYWSGGVKKSNWVKLNKLSQIKTVIKSRHVLCSIYNLKNQLLKMHIFSHFTIWLYSFHNFLDRRARH